jgi:rare lipoprotein A
MTLRLLLAALLISFIVAACSGSPQYSVDSKPGYEVTADQVYEAVPRAEPIRRAGNTSPYEVLGETYEVLSTAQGYRVEGRASWYGRKFHGRPTANGETFNMYAATAAHRSLPIPTYARVTNLDNGRSMIVKINDRGPFHSSRIIDLSYGAAVKLGFSEHGTAAVVVEALDVGTVDDQRLDSAQGMAAGETPNPYRYLQVASFSEQARARGLQQRLRDQLDQTGESVAAVFVSEVIVDDASRYRVRIGPVADRDRLVALQDELQSLGYPLVRMMP